MIDIAALLDKTGNKVGLNLRYFLSSGSWVAARYLLMGILSLGISVAFARLGSAELYGRYQFVLAIVSFFSILSLPGLNTVTLIAVARGVPRVLIDATRVCFRTAWLASLVVGSIGIYYISFKNQPDVGWSLIAASMLLPFFYGPNGWYTYYEGQKDFRSPTLRILLTNGLIASLLIIGLWRDWPLQALVIAYFAISAAAAIYFYREARGKIDHHPPVDVDVKTGIMYTLQKSSSTLPDTIQPLVISSLFGFGSLGIFMIAYTLVNSASGLMSALSATYFPLLLQYKKLMHQRIILQSLVLGVLLAFAYWVFVTVLFVPLYGERFLESFQLAQYFSIAVALMPLKLYFSSYFTAHNNPGLVIRANIGSYVTALLVFLVIGTSNAIATFVGYYVALQLAAVVMLGIAYFSHANMEQRHGFKNKSK